MEHKRTSESVAETVLRQKKDRVSKSQKKLRDEKRFFRKKATRQGI